MKPTNAAEAAAIPTIIGTINADVNVAPDVATAAMSLGNVLSTKLVITTFILLTATPTAADTATRSIKSVAAEGFAAPGVVVSYTDDADIQTGKKFAALGMQIAAGVPLQCDEGPDYRSFRVGLFGLDKLYDVDACVARLEKALDVFWPAR